MNHEAKRPIPWRDIRAVASLVMLLLSILGLAMALLSN